MQSRLILDVVVGQSKAVLELLAPEDESLLVRQNAFLVLNLLLHHLDSAGYDNLSDNGVARLYEGSPMTKCFASPHSSPLVLAIGRGQQ